ncbi:MAG: aminoacyl-tRNA deacylase [Aestuariibacter sp.]
MESSNRVTHYLDSQKITYNLVSHPHSKSSLGSAIGASIPLHQLAKAVILEDHEGRSMMAILPADHKVRIKKLNETLNRNFKLVKEAKIYQMFTDCDAGAVPPIPSAYHMDAIYEDELASEPVVFLECGDHETLIRLSRTNFLEIMASYKHGEFSERVFH